MPITINRRNIRFLPDPSRVIVRFLYLEPAARSVNVIRAVLGLSQSGVTYILGLVLRNFSVSRSNVSKIIEKNYNRISSFFTQLGVDPKSLSFSRKMIMGSYFTMEYVIESAVFSSPSIAEHPDQWLASSPYELEFLYDTRILEQVIFPESARKRKGIEDARFVKFREEDDSDMYYTTYAAYSDITVLPKMLSTRDFYHFKIWPLHGEIDQDKEWNCYPGK
jgi:hypothetical protein